MGDGLEPGSRRKERHPNKADWHNVYTSVLTCFAREDAWIHNRLTWAIQVNAAIVAGIFIFVATQRSGGKHLSDNFYFIMLVVSLFCAGFTVTAWMAIKAALDQLNYLKDYITRYADIISANRGVDLKLDDAIYHLTGYPRPYGDSKGFFIGRFAPTIFCAGIFVAWAMAGVWFGYKLYGPEQVPPPSCEIALAPLALPGKITVTGVSPSGQERSNPCTFVILPLSR